MINKSNHKPKKPKKAEKSEVHEKREKMINTIMAKLAILEKEEKLGDETVKSWAEKIILKESLKLINTLVNEIFDMSKTDSQISDCMHAIKLLIQLSPKIAIEKLNKEEDLNIKLVSYITNSENDKINDDSFFILNAISETPEKYEKSINFGFITRLFDIFDNLHDDSNFKAIVKILIQLNCYNPTIKELFNKVYKIHKNARLFNEILLRLINDEKNEKNIIQLLICVSNIMTTEKGKELFFYSNDIEIFLDIILHHLEYYYSDDLNYHILNTIYIIIQFPWYLENKSHFDDFITICEGFIDNDDSREDIKKKAEEILNYLKEPRNTNTTSISDINIINNK